MSGGVAGKKTPCKKACYANGANYNQCWSKPLAARSPWNANVHLRQAACRLILLLPLILFTSGGRTSAENSSTQTQLVRIGIVVSAQSGGCKGLLGTTPVPIDWPEQQVKIVEQDISPLVKKVSYRTLGGTVRQMVVEIPVLPAGKEAHAIVTFEVTRRAIVPPQDTSIYRLPLASDSKLRPYLQDSPYIESRHPKIKSAAKEALATQQGAWQQVEAIYDWVRDKVRYQEGPIKSALQALDDGDGDCEELSSLFIAMCRASGIPARLVWVPGHCYPEFCLQDAQGQVHWFPCQAAGARDFGSMTEFRPILQKGDNFRLPDRPQDRQRYVAEGLTGAGGQPTVKFVRDATPK